MYVFYLGTFNSIQNKFSALVNFTEISLLRTYDHQLEMYLKLSPMLVWNNYVSYERVIANYSTQVDVVSKRPKNQTGYSIASGFDIQMISLVSESDFWLSFTLLKCQAFNLL